MTGRAVPISAAALQDGESPVGGAPVPAEVVAVWLNACHCVEASDSTVNDRIMPGEPVNRAPCPTAVVVIHIRLAGLWPEFESFVGD